MTGVANALLVLVIIHLAMMILNPLLVFHTDKAKRQLGLRVGFAWLGMFCGYCVCSWLFKHVDGPQLLLTTEQWNILAITSWGTTVGGLVIVIYAFVKASRTSRQRPS